CPSAPKCRKVHCPCIEGGVTFNPASPLNEVQQTSGHPPADATTDIARGTATDLCKCGTCYDCRHSHSGKHHLFDISHYRLDFIRRSIDHCVPTSRTYEPAVVNVASLVNSIAP
ncbi:hypothetical protein VQ045_21725, partial [Aurantimonas sp. E1-2-R+4]|uniref:hypothetical protein n=1 Tax=Aurantimonas sp. E1-2-R+4 TaxID=3113714 RepID=UPI002F91FDC2